MDEIAFNWAEFDTAFARRAATSKRHHLALAVEQFRGLMREVVKITPPGHDGLQGGTKAAQEHGQAKAAADIHSLYGTPSDAYDRIAAVNESSAKVFWFMHEQGNEVKAAEIFKAKTGEWYGPFDGGKVHSTHYKRGYVSRRRGQPVIYISDSKALDEYVKEKQGHVMHLTAGWKHAFAKLGIPLQQFITRHNALGSMLIEISDDRFRFVAADAVSYAAATDLQRRIQDAIDKQTGKMQRQWEDYVAKLNKQAGL